MHNRRPNRFVTLLLLYIIRETRYSSLYLPPVGETAFTLFVDDDTMHELLLQRILIGNKLSAKLLESSQPSSDANEIPYECQKFQEASSTLIKSDI